jgi:hypothetical protein
VALPPCRLLRVTRSAYTGALAAARPGVTLSLPSVSRSMLLLLQRQAADAHAVHEWTGQIR